MATSHEAQALAQFLELSESQPKPKFKWKSDVSNLKLFVKEVLNVEGKWSYVNFSGGYELFKGSDFSMSFYHTTKTLSIQGTKNALYKDKLLYLIKSEDTQAENVNSIGRNRNEEEEIEYSGIYDPLADHSSFSRSNTISLGDDTLIIPSSPSSQLFITKNEFLQKMNDLQSQIDDLRTSSENPLKSALEIENHSLREKIESLVKENANLKQENTMLKQEKEHLIQSFNILSARNVQKEGKEKEVIQNIHDQIIIQDEAVQTKNNLHKDKKNEKKKKNNIQRNADDNLYKGENDNKSLSKQTPRDIFIVGDSMVKHLQGHKMAKHHNVKVWTFPGSSTSDMTHHIKPILKRHPHEIILHVGTNSLKNLDPASCAAEIIELGKHIKDAKVKTTISEIITRTDSPTLDRKAREVNTLLKAQCSGNGLSFIEHKNINEDDLNRSGLHLNRKGNKQFAINFINHFKSNVK